MGECLIIRGGGGTDTSNANATAGKVLTGYSCYVNDVLVTGSMPNQGEVTSTLDAGESYTIPAGYHNGSGKVSVNSLSSQTSASATAARILSNYTGWVNGSKLTGTMANRGAVSQSLAANGSYTIPAGWHNGSGKVSQSLTTQASVNVTPGTANKTACAANRWTTGNIVIVGSSNLKAANIKNGVTIFGVTGTWVGWVDPEMVLDDLIVSPTHSLSRGFVIPPYKVQLYWKINDDRYPVYGWNSISASLSNYNGPTSGTEDCAMSVWIRVSDNNKDNQVLEADFGEAGDVYYDFYCIGVLGYRQQTGMVWNVSMATDRFPQLSVRNINLVDTQSRPELASGTSARDAFLGGVASVTVVTSLLL